MKMSIPKTVSPRASRKTLYIVPFLALLAAIVGYLQIPTFNGSSLAASQNDIIRERATSEMLFRALDFKSASDLSIFARRGIVDKGNSKINGNTLDFRSIDSDQSSAGKLKARKDFSDSFSAVNQLPCAEIGDANLGGRTFGPGVYCLASARLAGELVLSGQGDPNAVFIFRIAGALRAEKGSVVSLADNAQAVSVFFVADDSAAVGEDVDFNGNILARGNIKIDADTTVDGRILSLEGAIDLNGGVFGAEKTGVLEICSSVEEAFGAGIENRIFRFRIGGSITEIPGGQCSGRLTVPSGPLVVEEMLDGRTTDGDAFDGNFLLTDVRALGDRAATALVGANLPLRTANVMIPEGDAANQTKIEFTSRYAVVGTVEICKEALDSGVTGFFNFTIDEIEKSGSFTLFVTPVGQCVGPISVSSPTVVVRESPRPGFIFTSATASVADRLIGVDVRNRAVTARIVDAGGSAPTKIFFNNRTEPTPLKICKIAGPGIPIGTEFTFNVDGRVALAPNADGVVPAGSQPSGTIAVTVPAGSASSGGNCQTVNAPGSADPVRFVVDTTATLNETTGDTVEGVSGQIRVSRITSTSGIVKANAAANTLPFGRPGGNVVGSSPFSLVRIPGMPLFPANATVNSLGRRVTVPIIRDFTEVEFVNIAFAPVPLKICKIAGPGIPVGTPFTFNIVTDTAGGLLASTSATVTILAGPVAAAPGAQSGFCDFVNGPFGGSFGGAVNGAIINGLGSFNLNSAVTVTEASTFNFVATSITSPTNSIIVNLPTRSAVITNMINGVNELQFVNSSAVSPPPPPPKKRRRVF